MDVEATDGCDWNLATEQDWLLVSANSDGTGDETATGLIDANLTEFERIGTVELQALETICRIQGRWNERRCAEGRVHGRGLVARLEGITDREVARTLVGAEIAVLREQLPALTEGDYYWADLIGLRVLTEDGLELGVIDYLFETGANDVLVVKGDRERLIPYVQGDVIKGIDLEQGEMRVDWDPDY